MFDSYLPIAIMIVAATLFAAGTFTASWIAGLVKGSRTSKEVYECGMPLLDEAEKRVSVRYYLVVLLFVLFDIEALLLFPLAAAFREALKDPMMGIKAFLELAIFILVLLIGFVYLFKKGAFRWE